GSGERPRSWPQRRRRQVSPRRCRRGRRAARSDRRAADGAVTAPSPFADTIAAIATAPGRGAVALIRISGPTAGEILLRVGPALQGRLPPPRRQRVLPIVHPVSGELLDHALISWFP